MDPGTQVSPVRFSEPNFDNFDAQSIMRIIKLNFTSIFNSINLKKNISNKLPMYFDFLLLKFLTKNIDIIFQGVCTGCPLYSVQFVYTNRLTDFCK